VTTAPHSLEQRRRAGAPAAVRLSVALWLTAIAAGAVEAAVRLLLPEPPSMAQLAVRFGLYTGLAVLVMALHTGRNAVRWAVALLLGGIGTLSLVVEPVSWLLAGTSPAVFFASADTTTLVITGLRVLHIAAVFAALTLLFRPVATTFFRGA
jgi:hypothetical protein